MATKKKTNTISALYKTIDQKQLSDQAKETLKKLRLATGNFRSKDERANEAFNAFYTKLLEKKPSAVKTTKEYKDMVRQRQVEHMKKIREARKEKEESKKGQGNDRDAARPAKPYGWRLRGKHNYRKPTLKQIRNGEAYYEGRVNRADVKRKKFPMLEKGGKIDYYNPRQSLYGEWFRDVDKDFKDSFVMPQTKEEYRKKYDTYKYDGENYEKIQKSSKMMRSYDALVEYNLYENLFQAEMDSDMERYYNLLELGKYLNIYPRFYMADGGYMEHEYKVTLQNSDSGDIEIVNVLANSIQEAENKAIEESGLSGYEVIKTDKFSNGGEMESEYKVTLQNTDSGDIEIVSVLANSIQEAEKSAIEESGLNGYEVIKTMKYAKGGMTDHNLMIGDTIKQSFGNILVVENDGKTYLVNINTGQRWTDSEWWSLSKGEITKYTKMAKGGEIKYSTYENKSMEYIEGEIAHTERSARQFQQMGDYESMEDRKEHVRKLREIYNRKRAESKMAQGGEVRNYKTYVEQYPDGKIYVRVKFSGLDKDVQNYVANEENKTKAINFAKRLAEKNNGTYEGFKNFSMAQGGEVFYKESHKMGH